MTRPDRSRAPGKRSNATGGSPEGTKRHCTRHSNGRRVQQGYQRVEQLTGPSGGHTTRSHGTLTPWWWMEPRSSAS